MKFYFYQPGKDTYFESIYYYPIELEYFNIPEGETLKTMIESGRIIMSNSEEMIKKTMEMWKDYYKDMQKEMQKEMWKEHYKKMQID